MTLEKFDYEILKVKFAEVRGRHNIEFDLKEEQINIAYSFLNGRSALGLLPKGFGKMLCIVIPTMIKAEQYPITLVISLPTSFWWMIKSKPWRPGTLLAQRLAPYWKWTSQYYQVHSVEWLTHVIQNSLFIFTFVAPPKTFTPQRKMNLPRRKEIQLLHLYMAIYTRQTIRPKSSSLSLTHLYRVDTSTLTNRTSLFTI